jgi:GT2 family glycosyltransferase
LGAETSPSTFDLSVVIVSFNTRDLLRESILSVERETGSFRVEILVVDSASKDGSPDMVRTEFPHVRLWVSDQNLGFAGANNVAFREARGRYTILLNSDAFLEPGSLQIAVRHMEQTPNAGLGGAKLIGRDGIMQPSARMFPSLLNEVLTMSGLAYYFPRSRFFGRMDRTWADPDQPASVDWVPGAFCIARTDVLRQVQFFDENFFLYSEEVDLCFRIRQAGYAIWYWPDIKVIHIGGESSKTVKQLEMSSTGAQLVLWRMRSTLLYYRKHHGSAAWWMMALERSWHSVRAWKNTLSSSDTAQRKARESRRLAALMKQAWTETSGGRVSPPRPW